MDVIGKSDYIQSVRFKRWVPRASGRNWPAPVPHKGGSEEVWDCSSGKSGTLPPSGAKGTVNASVITPREILIEGLRSLAVSMILVHNHPSGDPSPSESDLLLTRRVKEAGDVIGISLLDHIIIGDKRYLSFRQQQIM